MDNNLPIRSKLAMAEDVSKIVSYLHSGNRTAAIPLLEDLKVRSIFLDEQIQQDVLAFISQVLFQYDYDPWHKVTYEVERAANKLIEDMGFRAP